MTGKRARADLSPGRAHPGAAGFTLVELLAALAVFALLATMGIQTLNATLRARDQLAGAAVESAELDTALTLLRADLRAAAPLGFRTPGNLVRPALVFDPTAARLSLSTAGRPRLPGEASAGRTRVIWRLDRLNARLLRQDWPILAPASTAALRPARVMLTGVTALRVAVYSPDAGWHDATPPGAEAMGITTLPRGVRVEIDTRGHGTLRVVAAP